MSLRVMSEGPDWDDPAHYAWRVQVQWPDGTWHNTDIHGESNWDLINEIVNDALEMRLRRASAAWRASP